MIPNSLRSRSLTGRKIIGDARAAYQALLPSFAVLVVFVLFPLGYSLYLSFHRWSLIRGQPAWIGLSNYATAFASDEFWSALSHTLYYSAGTVIGTAVIALGIAVLLNGRIRGAGLYRTAFFIPEVFSTVVVALIWMWILDPHDGLVNRLLRTVSLPTPGWFTDPVWAMPGLILMGIWKNVGHSMIVFLAALQGVPHEYQEAAMIDGAGPWQRFRWITLPLLRPATAFVITVGTIKSFQVFGQVYATTKGGPMGKTTVLVYYMYEQTFEFFRLGYGAAVAWILAILLLGLSVVQLKLLRSRE